MKYILINSLKAGGAERVAQILSSKIADGIIMLENEKDFTVDIPVKTLSAHTSKTNALVKTIFIPLYAFRLGKIIKKNDIVISFIERANFVNIISKLFWKNKSVITIHTGLTNAFKNKKKIFYYVLIKLLYPLADMIVPVSFGIAHNLESFVKINPQKLDVIYNPIELEKIQIASKEHIEERYSDIFSNKVIITAGRLMEEKAQWILLNVFQRANEKIKNLKLVILGEGLLKNTLVHHGQKIGLHVFHDENTQDIRNEYDVYFLGYQKNPYAYFAKAKLFFLSSTREGFPMVVLEAMACGLPVISTDCDYGPREELSLSKTTHQITQAEFADFGLLLPVIYTSRQKNDNALEKEWANGLIKIMDDEALIKSYAEKSKKRSHDFSVDKIIPQWKELLEKLENLE